MTGTSTADRITAAALRLLTERGAGGLTMEDVRRAAQVSNGSLYHHFPTRAELTARLLLVGMTDCQDGIREALAAAGDARAGIQDVVRAQLAWVEANPELARLLYGDVPDDVLRAAEPAFSTANAAYVEEVGGWLRAQADRGQVIDGWFGTVHALWLGPVQELARNWLQGRSRVTPTEAAPDLAAGAWRALAAR
jgi:AcrR family transcriptional regulator